MLLDDFLLTYLVFMSTNDLCQALLGQYPSLLDDKRPCKKTEDIYYFHTQGVDAYVVIYLISQTNAQIDLHGLHSGTCVHLEFDLLLLVLRPNQTQSEIKK